MATVWNIRGTNGSGKSHLVRCFLPPSCWAEPNAVLGHYPSPTRVDPDRVKPVPGHVVNFHEAGYVPFSVGAVGSYATPTGGMDGLPTFAVCRAAIWRACSQAKHVLAEGVLASTVYGSWARFDDDLRAGGHRFVWVYMSTPIEVCLERIKHRQEAAGRVRQIKTDQVINKVTAIARTYVRALDDGRDVLKLSFGVEANDLHYQMENAR